MSYQSSTAQPLCRNCGKRIKKLTNLVMFAAESDRVEGWWLYRAAFPKTKAEAQREVEQQIVSVSYASPYFAEKRGHSYIDKATTWDGKSYQDEWFCGGNCRNAFAVLMAARGHCTTDYTAALERQQKKEKIA